MSAVDEYYDLLRDKQQDARHRLLHWLDELAVDTRNLLIPLMTVEEGAFWNQVLLGSGWSRAAVADLRDAVRNNDYAAVSEAVADLKETSDAYAEQLRQRSTQRRALGYIDRAGQALRQVLGDDDLPRPEVAFESEVFFRIAMNDLGGNGRADMLTVATKALRAVELSIARTADFPSTRVALCRKFVEASEQLRTEGGLLLHADLAVDPDIHDLQRRLAVACSGTADYSLRVALFGASFGNESTPPTPRPADFDAAVARGRALVTATEPPQSETDPTPSL